MTLSQIFILLFSVGPIYCLVSLVVGKTLSESNGEIEEFDLDDDIEVFDLPDSDLSHVEDDFSHLQESPCDDPDLDFEAEAYPDSLRSGDDYDDRNLHKLNKDLGSIQFNFNSITIWSIVISAFGAGGYIAKEVFLLSIFLSLIAAFSLSFIIWMGCVFFLNFFFSQSLHNSRTPSLKGMEGRVVLEIPEIGIGQVSVKINREFQIYRARSFAEEIIPFNSTVEIIDENLNNRLLIVRIKN